MLFSIIFHNLFHSKRVIPIKKNITQRTSFSLFFISFQKFTGESVNRAINVKVCVYNTDTKTTTIQILN